MDENPQIDTEDQATDAEASTPALTMRGSFGTAVGAAMLGFEQALRSGPPPEVLAAEHIPERGYSGDASGDLVIVIPESPARPDPPNRD